MNEQVREFVLVDPVIGGMGLGAQGYTRISAVAAIVDIYPGARYQQGGGGVAAPWDLRLGRNGRHFARSGEKRYGDKDDELRGAINTSKAVREKYPLRPPRIIILNFPFAVPLRRWPSSYFCESSVCGLFCRLVETGRRGSEHSGTRKKSMTSTRGVGQLGRVPKIDILSSKGR